MYPATGAGMADPDPSMAAVVEGVQGDDSYALIRAIEHLHAVNLGAPRRRRGRG